MRITIVNEDDEVIGAKERADINFETDIYRVSSLLLKNSIGEVLIQKRAGNKIQDPGRWSMAVAGTVEENESYEENILKETFEEIGLKDLNMSLGPKIRIKGPSNFFCQWYFAEVDQKIKDFIYDKDEVSDLRWINLKTLKKDVLKNSQVYVKSMQRTIDDLNL